ncbi:MAG: response regulator [Candidatus Schekmanbacteria bacterium]|nr:response regulator [Candidatus Schekmanbacteria bacterium]
MKTVEVLLVEDDPEEVARVREAFLRANLRSRLHVLRDGRVVLDFLRRKPPYEEAARPRLVLMNMDSPGVGGLEVLQEMQTDPMFRRVPVIMLTVSAQEENLLETRATGACSFVRKPVDERKIRVVGETFGLYRNVHAANPEALANGGASPAVPAPPAVVEAAAEDARRARGELLSLISHDLRTPLATVSLAAQELLELGERLTPQQRTHLLDIIRRAAKHGLRLVDDLTDLDYLERGALPLQRASLDLNAVVAEAVQALLPLARSAEVSLRARLWEKPLILSVDRERVAQIVENLVGNALRFAQSAVLVLAEPVGSEVHIVVEDDGPGVAADMRERIFTRFATAARVAGQRAGIGLGLAIVRGLATSHGGHAWVEDRAVQAAGEPCSGARFVVSLPRREDVCGPAAELATASLV